MIRLKAEEDLRRRRRGDNYGVCEKDITDNNRDKEGEDSDLSGCHASFGVFTEYLSFVNPRLECACPPIIALQCTHAYNSQLA